MLKNKIVKILLFLLISNIVWADQLHYKNILVGERASGLAGAFSAVSDDPSGAYYNPAGLAFANKSYISISTNTYKSSNSRYLDVLADDQNVDHNWSRNSSSFIPSYFGVLQDFEKFKFVFSMINPQSEVINQDDVVTVESVSSTFNRQFLRNYNETDSTLLVGPSIAFLADESLSFGMSLFGTYRSKQIIDNQWIDWTGSDEWYKTWQNFYLEEMYAGLLGIVGMQYMPSKELSLAFVIKDNFDLITSSTGQTIAQDSGVTNNSIYSTTATDLLALGYKREPFSMTAGMAYFFSPALMWTMDLNYYAAYKASTVEFDKKSLINLATGLEYYYTPNTPLRLGYYTNNSNLSTHYAGAYDINLSGITFSIGSETEFSSLSFGLDYSSGTGKSQVFSGQDLLFDADMSNLSFFFSGSYMM
jgi:hypothetical protein